MDVRQTSRLTRQCHLRAAAINIIPGPESRLRGRQPAFSVMKRKRASFSVSDEKMSRRARERERKRAQQKQTRKAAKGRGALCGGVRLRSILGRDRLCARINVAHTRRMYTVTPPCSNSLRGRCAAAVDWSSVAPTGRARETVLAVVSAQGRFAFVFAVARGRAVTMRTRRCLT